MKGVIVAAGYGTRFLPVTKAIPKEMLPLVAKPSIDYIVEEFLASGITDIVVISSRRKKCLEDYLDREVELESVFEREGKADKLAAIQPPAANFSFVRQREMRGTGHALMMAAPFLGGEPCVVAYPDDLHVGEKPLALQLVDAYKATGCSVMAALPVEGDVSRYGVLDPAPDGLHVKAIVEKPAKGREPSKLVSIGRYLFTPEFFSLLEEGWKKHTGGEYYHIYALNALMSAGKVVMARMTGERLDTGEPAGFLDAYLREAAKVPELRKIIEDFAKGM
jgi:UTP--glucose-1-phosphate uridylyltransferase